ncbi:peptide ABC transporter permease [Priestia koreensis]|uniref:peptide ABC transporter permease n=1 Tax=Priestia koreensis TaxID=284581 RepID=UPI001F57B38E|nr:peptide ABC transporter permease [Priestia koreensis]MCM3003118.1 peptide ABC transporter permease [Priestia koreensis]UNL85926.1 peptide ABC transporter permease [Priestia koreensis]
MSKVDTLRDIVYINGNLHEQYFITHGIEFREFFHSIPTPLANVLLLKHGYEESDYDFGVHLDYVENEQLPRLVEEDVSKYGDFCWVDFDEPSSFELLHDEDLAALLYLGHYKKPLRTAFSHKLNNQFVYLSSEDGWFNKTYYRNIYDMNHIVSRVIPMKLSVTKQSRFTFLKKKLEYPPVPLVLVNTLLTLANDGLVVDLKQVQQTRKDIQIPIFTIGKYIDMEEMLHDLEESSHKGSFQATLVLNKKDLEWELIEM